MSSLPPRRTAGRGFAAEAGGVAAAPLVPAAGFSEEARNGGIYVTQWSVGNDPCNL